MSDESDLRIFEKVQFRGWLEQAAQQPEFVRVDSMMMYLRARLVSPYLTQDECFIAVYGPDGARKFWEVLSAEPIKISVFVDLLATTRARDKDEKKMMLVNPLGGGARRITGRRKDVVRRRPDSLRRRSFRLAGGEGQRAGRAESARDRGCGVAFAYAYAPPSCS
jgi:hypothetical protein